MKTKLIYTFAFALVCAFAATGCRHQPGKLTHMPNTGAPTVQDDTGFRTKPYQDNTSIAATPGETFDNMAADRAALAANTIHFAYDSAAIKKAEQANLQAVAQALSADRSTKLLIEGNCDERGTEEYNRALGDRRANAARQALVKLGIDAMRIQTKSFGKDKPATPGHDEASRAQNRRDEFILLHPLPGMTPMGGS